MKIMINDISLTVNIIFNSLPLDLQSDFLNNITSIDIESQLKEKVKEIYNDAVLLLRDFRNIMMNKRIKQNTFDFSNKFKNYNGALFTLFKLYLQKELL